jgi:hypothetical protein
MRKQPVSSIVMIGFLLMAGSSLLAAAASGSQISAKIPFSFVVKDKVPGCIFGRSDRCESR